MRKYMDENSFPPLGLDGGSDSGHLELVLGRPTNVGPILLTLEHLMVQRMHA